MADHEPDAGHALVLADRGAASTAKHIGLAVVKGAIGAIPFAGTAINEALFETRSRLQQERVNALVDRLAVYAAALGEEKIDTTYIQTDEFSDVITDIVVRTARTRSETKRERFAQIIAGAMSGRREGAFDSAYRQLVEDLSDDDLDILKRFLPAYAVSKNANKSDDWHMPLVSKLDYSEASVFERPPIVVKTIIQNLIRMGLLFDDSHGRMSSVPYTIIMPTDLGASFYDWLQALPCAA